MLTLTRRYKFSAGHRLCRRDLSDEENMLLYGKCAYPEGHGHNYYLYVTVSGSISESTGMIINIGVLDKIVHEKVLAKLDHKFLNYDLDSPFLNVFTSENLCNYIWHQLKNYLKDAQLVALRLYETDNNFFEINQ